MQFGWLYLVVMATFLFLSSADQSDAELKQIANSSSGAVNIKTHVVWRPSVDTDEVTQSTQKLIILPLAAFLALIIAICAKISHWWNEDIREADGILQNAYSAKRPHHPVLVRTDTFEYDFNYFLPPPFCATQNGQYLSLPQTTIGPVMAVSSESYSPTKPHPSAKGACTSDKRTPKPLLQYEMEIPPTPEIVLKPSKVQSPDILMNKRPKRPRSRRRSRLSRTRPPGVSKLVMDSLHFNLYLLRLNMKADGCKPLESAFARSRQSNGRAIRPKPHRKCARSNSKPSSSSFSSYETSSTSLSTELGDSKFLPSVDGPRSPSLSSDSGASSDIIWELPNPEFLNCQANTYDNFHSTKHLLEPDQFCSV